ncbi:MAG: hypothetical protein ACI8PG_000535 [Planctomycetota bacterium]|jgi:hypothetical protein
MALKSYLFLLVIVLAAGMYIGASNSAEAPTAPDRVRLQEVTLPADGLALYKTLLKEIPEVVSEVPCACCNQKLSTCYGGFCPPT